MEHTLLLDYTYLVVSVQFIIICWKFLLIRNNIFGKGHMLASYFNVILILIERQNSIEEHLLLVIRLNCVEACLTSELHADLFTAGVQI